MPVHKLVPTLSTLCVQRIGQLFIDLTKGLSQCSASKKNAIPSQLKSVNENDAGHTSEGNSANGETQSQNETKEMEDKNSPTQEWLERKCFRAPPPPTDLLTKEPLSLPPENEDQRRKKQEDLEQFCQDLGQALTSHSHVTLHRTLFGSISTLLDPIYMKEKSSRHAIRSALVPFLNASLRELDFGERRMFSEPGMCQAFADHLHKAVKLETLIIGRSCYWRSQIFEKLNLNLMNLVHLKF
ncbi:hypothetical protein GWK47_054258 [Chionoecetes opilio]|uniref:Uncharacterized protein n=1 Tax=Chionoecetes opilio TaxID=41210 RepID=A0A8J5CP51_CHIOP|nr:hypothetical protein GWK47_054258 [Chionoecetes opilio]